MAQKDFDDFINRSLEIRKKYHQLEVQHHGNEWTVEKCLNFFNRCRFGRKKYYAQQEHWPKANSQSELEHKRCESMGWLIVIANRTDIDIKDAVANL